MKARLSDHPKARRAVPEPDFFSSDVVKARRFYLDLNPSRARPLVVVCGGVEQSTPAYSIQRGTFPFYSLEYVARGEGEVVLNGRRYPLQAGSVFSYGPGVPHRITGSAHHPLIKYFVDFSGRRAAQLLASCGLTAGRISQVFPPQALAALFEEMIEGGIRLGPKAGNLCAGLLECLALKLQSARAPTEGADTPAFRTYQHCRGHIEQHYLRLRTLAGISAECHVTSAHLCRLFGRYDHQSPYQYLLRLKMSAAAARLGQPDALVKQVAEEVGFPDPYHFSRVFKSVLGVSPGQGARTATGTRHGAARIRRKSRGPVSRAGLRVTVTVSTSATAAPGVWMAPVS
jgi:AraC-like DNA-binding protein